jgi:hypothetical protein
MGKRSHFKGTRGNGRHFTLRSLGSPAKISKQKVIPSHLIVVHSFIRSKSQIGHVRFVAEYNASTGYKLDLESADGSNRGSFGPTSAASHVMADAYDAVYGARQKPRHFTTERAALFPFSSDLIQTQLKKRLGFGSKSKPSRRQLDAKLTMYKSKHTQSGKNLGLSFLKVLVPRITSEGEIARTAKLGKISTKTIPLKEYCNSNEAVVVAQELYSLQAAQVKSLSQCKERVKQTRVQASAAKAQAERALKQLRKNAIVLEPIRKGKNKAHSPMTTFGRILAVKVVSAGNMADGGKPSPLPLPALLAVISCLLLSLHQSLLLSPQQSLLHSLQQSLLLSLHQSPLLSLHQSLLHSLHQSLLLSPQQSLRICAHVSA